MVIRFGTADDYGQHRMVAEAPLATSVWSFWCLGFAMILLTTTSILHTYKRQDRDVPTAEALLAYGAVIFTVGFAVAAFLGFA